jgi:hypothetical protein
MVALRRPVFMRVGNFFSKKSVGFGILRVTTCKEANPLPVNYTSI